MYKAWDILAWIHWKYMEFLFIGASILEKSFIKKAYLWLTGACTSSAKCSCQNNHAAIISSHVFHPTTPPRTLKEAVWFMQQSIKFPALDLGNSGSLLSEELSKI